jgi:uncharacterized RDD family membrane protein YckC
MVRGKKLLLRGVPWQRPGALFISGNLLTILEYKLNYTLPMETVNPNSTSNELLGDVHQIAVLNYASRGQRFANYIIDSITSLALAILTGIGIIAVRGESAEWILEETVPLYALIYTGIIAYYSLAEAFLKGRTLGKLITGTHAVTIDGEALSFGNALLRSLCRIVPFEALSGFSAAPWHDQWTGTTVVKN